MSLTQEQKDTIQEELFYESGLEELLITAELGHLAKDPKKHKDEIRGLIKGIEEWVFSKLDQAYQLGAKDKVEEIEVSCIRDSLLGKSDEYLKGWNDCSTEWRRVRDESLKDNT